jgi:hypothetical protein
MANPSLSLGIKGFITVPEERDTRMSKNREETVVLVAFVVETFEDGQHYGESRYQQAERVLTKRLHPLLQSQDETSPIDSWWVANDTRYDGSDLDSAVFVKPGAQAEASRLLLRADLTYDHNVVGPDVSPGRFEAPGEDW